MTGGDPAVENGKRRLGESVIIDVRVKVMKLDIPGTVGKKPPHEGTETVRVVKICPRPVPFTAAACRKKKGCWPRCACQTLQMCICNHQTIRLAKHDRRDQAIVRMGRIAVPFRGKLLPADHIDKFFVALGDMLELGSQAEELHALAGADVAAHGAAGLFTSGALAAVAGEAAARAGVESQVLQDLEGQAAGLLARLGSGDVVLVKGSRGARMERFSGALSSGKRGSP